MDQATRTMIENLEKNSGKSMQEWIQIVNKESFAKHGEIVFYLKNSHSLTHGYANLVAHMSKKSKDSSDNIDENEIINQHYLNKEHLRPIYDLILQNINSFGADFEIAPKKAYVSLRRKKQFATLQPATKTRFEIGLNLKGHKASGVLEEITAANAMCSHKINISDISEINTEVLDWLKLAYEEAG